MNTKRSAYTPVYAHDVFWSMTQPCKHRLLSGVYALPRPQLGHHVKQKRALGLAGDGFLPLEPITQVLIDRE